MQLTFRETNKETDQSVCAALMSAAKPWSDLFFSTAQCQTILSSSRLVLHVVEAQDAVVGFIATRPDGIEGEPLLEYMCLRDIYRNQGIGTQLLHFFEEGLYRDADNLYLFVSDINPGAIRLYERSGYIKIGELPNYNLFGQTELLYRKFRRPRQARYAPTQDYRLFQRANGALRNTQSLTEQQDAGQAAGAFDLATGYARIPLTAGLRDHVIAGTSASLFGDPEGRVASCNLCAAVTDLLHLDQQIQGRIHPTFSGSIALDRVFAALRQYAQMQAKNGLVMILPEPSIDLWSLLLREHTDIRVEGVRHESVSSRGRTDALIDALSQCSRKFADFQLALVLDNPSNPFGMITEDDDMFRLAKACAQYQAFLVGDHCLMMSGMHFPKRIPTVFQLPPDLCNWIGIWDTGKTFDLGGDKLGVIVSASPEIDAAICESLAVIQPSSYSARRAMEVFSRTLSSDEASTYLGNAASICSQNFSLLTQTLGRTWNIPEPQAGTFACLFHRDPSVDSASIRKLLLMRGVSVAAGETFYNTTIASVGEGQPFVRISLMRPLEYFRAAIEQGLAWA